MPKGVYVRTKPSWTKGKHIVHSGSFKKGYDKRRTGIFKKGHKDIVTKEGRKKQGENHREEKHYNWKGDSAGYTAIHTWIRKHKGKSSCCEVCGLDDPSKRYHWANIDHSYRRFLDDYMSMCPRCHSKYDKDFLDCQTGRRKGCEYNRELSSEMAEQSPLNTEIKHTETPKAR